MKSVRITIALFVLLIVAFLSLAGRCFYLQYYQKDHYRNISLKQQRLYNPLKPQRGTILDSRGRVLAASNKIQTVFVEPRIVKDRKEIAEQLAVVLNMQPHLISQIIAGSRNPGFVKIKVGASVEECQQARKIYGVGVASEWQRSYPMGRLVGHVIGFTSSDNRGLSGIELQLDKELSGSLGENIFYADAFRRPIRLKEQQSILNDGCGVVLTIDASIQQFARSELLKQYESYEAESAVAIVAEPKSGAILAMVSLPDFDPNDRSGDPNSFRNRAITDQFEPGSMLKPVAVAIAIDGGAIGRNEKIYCEKGNYRGKGFGRIGEYGNHRYGNLRIREILVKSSNIGMAKIGQKMGNKMLYKGLRLFGFGKKTGVDLPGEVSGLLRPTSQWTGYSTTRIPFGQEITVTAIQMVRAFCVLANGGRSVRPYVVKALVGSDGEIVKLKLQGESVGFVIKPDVANWIVGDALVGVVNERRKGGTGWRAKLDKWQVFGKTGTADIAKSDGRGYDGSANIASFIAGAPAEDPQIVVLVSIRKPNRKLGKGHTGGSVASPVAGRIIKKTLTYLEKKHL